MPYTPAEWRPSKEERCDNMGDGGYGSTNYPSRERTKEEIIKQEKKKESGRKRKFNKCPKEITVSCTGMECLCPECGREMTVERNRSKPKIWYIVCTKGHCKNHGNQYAVPKMKLKRLAYNLSSY